MGKNIKTKKGFTIIEVVLVLAIAGLIFLMVFVAFPTAQATQRDNQRRDDYAMLSGQISNFSTSNNGKLIRLVGAKKMTDDASKDLNPANYIHSTGEDPNGFPYQLTAYTYTAWDNAGKPQPKDSSNSGSSEEGEEGGSTEGTQVFVILGADCDGDSSDTGFSTPGKNNSTRAFAIYGFLETGSQTYCSASQ